MGKIFCLLGKSNAGKDTIFKELLLDCDLKLEPVVSYTTRPKRDNEKEGQEYHFINTDELEQFKKTGKVIELREYDTVHGKWYYATINDGQIELDARNYLIIVTLDAFINIKEYFGDDLVIPFYIDLDDGIRLERALMREKQQIKPNYEELCRRFIADNKDFSCDRLEGSGIDKRYINDKLEVCLNEVKKDILDNIG